MGNKSVGRSTEARPRAPRNSISRDRIFSVALELIDAHGLEQLTMARLAGALGVGTMSLYRHVASKSELIDALADSVFASVAVPAGPPDDWRGRVVGYLLDWRAQVLAHPAMVPVLAGRRLPLRTDHLEEVLSVMRDAGFADREAVRAFYALFCYVLGFVVWEVPKPPESLEDSWEATLSSLPAGPYRVLHASREWLTTAAGEDQFRYGLEHLAGSLEPGGLT